MSFCRISNWEVPCDEVKEEAHSTVFQVVLLEIEPDLGQVSRFKYLSPEDRDMLVSFLDHIHLLAAGALGDECSLQPLSSRKLPLGKSNLVLRGYYAHLLREP